MRAPCRVTLPRAAAPRAAARLCGAACAACLQAAAAARERAAGHRRRPLTPARRRRPWPLRRCRYIKETLAHKTAALGTETILSCAKTTLNSKVWCAPALSAALPGRLRCRLRCSAAAIRCRHLLRPQADRRAPLPLRTRSAPALCRCALLTHSRACHHPCAQIFGKDSDFFAKIAVEAMHNVKVRAALLFPPYPPPVPPPSPRLPSGPPLARRRKGAARKAGPPCRGSARAHLLPLPRCCCRCLPPSACAQTIGEDGKPRYPVKSVGIMCQHGGSAKDSRLLNGYVVMMARAAQGMPTAVHGARIALLDIDLRKSKMHMGVQVLVSDPSELAKIRAKELDITADRIKLILGAPLARTPGLPPPTPRARAAPPQSRQLTARRRAPADERPTARAQLRAPT